MVSEDLRRIISRITSRARILGVGAESVLLVAKINNYKIILKFRKMKPYMDPELAKSLTILRTIKESKIIAIINKNRIPSPRILFSLPKTGLIGMEYIEGTTLKEALERELVDPRTAGRVAGEIIGRVHSIGIVHGDPTTSNYIVKNNNYYLIDYGLSEFSDRLEDRAVDIHLFRRATLATHAKYAGILIESFLDGYRAALGEPADKVIERASKLELMGRYVAERRTVWSKQNYS
ncbi:MAG: Kae1-associated kinase Bud32 [Desulfurococcales archaeon]|nr:Kae1-associated kinase Bud32 [Desulfurococcales archaeon]